MGWLDILLGRTRAVKPALENLFSISTSRITLQAKVQADPTGHAGIAFKPVESSFFDDAEKEVRGLLGVGAGESGTEFHVARDTYGFQWVVLFDKEFEDLVAAVHMTSETLQEHGFGGQLLAALFEFTDREGRQIYWIYNYKRGKFYPFVPLPGKKRDNAFELRLRALLEKEMPIEPELERWYPLWDIPLNPERDPHG